MILLMASLLAPWLFAYALLRCGDPAGRSEAGRCLHACLAVGMGMGLSSCSYFLWILCVGPPGRVFWIAESLGFALGGLLVLAARRGRPSIIGMPAATAPSLRRWHVLLTAVFIAALVLAAVGMRGTYVARPYGDWDAWAIWNMRARFLFGLGDQWRQAFLAKYPHGDYPLLIPLTNARWWSCLGRDPTWVPAVVGALFTFAAAGLLATGIGRLRGRGLGLLAGTVLLGTEAFRSLGAAQYADVPLAFFILGSVLLLALDDAAEQSSRGLLLLAGLSAALAAWTKNEGLLFLVVVLAVRSIVVGRRSGGRPMLRQLALLLAGAAPVLAVVILFKLSVASGNDLVGGQSAQASLPRLVDAWRYWLVTKALVHHAVALSDGYVVVFPLCFWLLGRGPRRPRLALAGIVGVVGLMLAGYFFIYIVTPHDLKWHLSTSVLRLLLHLWPAAILAVFLALSDPVQLLAETSPAWRPSRRFRSLLKGIPRRDGAQLTSSSDFAWPTAPSPPFQNPSS
jgi:hypothetical protein